MAVFLLVSISGCVETETEPDLAIQTQAIGANSCDGLQHALENCPNATACAVIEDLLAAHGCVVAPMPCPCFDLAMLQDLGTATVWGQQRFLTPEGGGLNWVGQLVGGSNGFAQVMWGNWDAGGNRCWYNDYSSPVAIDYDSALVCDALLNQHALNVGARCGSAFCP
jgi:hypothetical protein